MCVYMCVCVWRKTKTKRPLVTDCVGEYGLTDFRFFYTFRFTSLVLRVYHDHLSFEPCL